MRVNLAVLALSLPAAPFACTTVEPTVLTANGDGLGHENQGRHLLGGLDQLSIDGNPYWVSTAAAYRGNTRIRASVVQSALYVVEGSNVWVGADQELIGIRFQATDNSELWITEVLPPTSDGLILYRLEYRDNNTVLDPCDGEAAIAIAGSYTAVEGHLASANALTFSCESGVAFKCHKWGYAPGDDSQAVAWALHQTCTRLAKADYCGTGKSFTREGTSVSMFDRDGVRTKFPENWSPWLQPSPEVSWPPPRGEYYLEAVWGRDGALCLSRARWASLPPKPCEPPFLVDPRHDVDMSGAYCEDVIDNDLLNPSRGALIASISTINDLGLVTWRSRDGDLLTTISGYHDPRGASIPPFPGMEYVRSSDVLLRELVAEVDPADLAAVHMYCIGNSDRCVVTTAATRPATHTVDHGVEGYVFKTLHDYKTRELRLYENTATGDYVTSTVPVGAEYTLESVVGHVLKATGLVPSRSP